MDITHISYYSLILEDKTYFYHQYLKGNFKPMDEDNEAIMYEYVMNFLTNHGYDQYEISNYAKIIHYSLHNIYWTLGEYIGVGLGALGLLIIIEHTMSGMAIYGSFLKGKNTSN